MQNLDQRVFEQGYTWLCAGEVVYLCTVLRTYGSSPRVAGSVLVAKGDGQFEGSLSGGCVEEDLIRRIGEGAFSKRTQIIEYGKNIEESEHYGLPCGGQLKLLVEAVPATTEERADWAKLLHAFSGEVFISRQINLARGRVVVAETRIRAAAAIIYNGDDIVHTLSPLWRIIICGVSAVSRDVATLGVMLGYQCCVCDPRSEVSASWDVQGCELVPCLADDYLLQQDRLANCAVVALTHNQNFDDLAMLEAVNTDAFYIGAIGSQRTSAKRFERLQRAGLTRQQLARIHAPIGLPIGSKTPTEIAVAIVADITRYRRSEHAR